MEDTRANVRTQYAATGHQHAVVDGDDDANDDDNATDNEDDVNDDEDDADDVNDVDYKPPRPVEVKDVGEDLRRSQRTRVPVERYVAGTVEVSSTRDPVTVGEALGGTDAGRWKEAMEAEHQSLIDNKTWILVDLPAQRKAIANKWVFKRKLGANGMVVRYKARLVVKGCSQRAGIDYAETFSPVVRYASIRFLIAMSAKLDPDIDQMDDVTAFLQSELKEEVYMMQPTGLEDGTSRVCRLKKSLYGLKQSSRVWNDKLGAALVNAGLKVCKADTCIYHRVVGDDVLIVAVYVDDLLLFTNRPSTKRWIKEQLLRSFKMTDSGEAKYVLGMHIERDRQAGTIKLHQRKYLLEVLERFHMAECNPVSTPADPAAKLTVDMAPNYEAGREEMANVPYQEAVGSVMYAAQESRPDIQYAVHTVSRFNNIPGNPHWNAVKRIMRYLRGTIDAKLTYRRDDTAGLHGYSDADWAGDVSDRRSVTGYVFLLQGGAVAWNSRKQPTVALSTTEAEYMALATATQEAIWLRSLYGEIFTVQNEHMRAITIFGLLCR